jgi:hypothetical protein
MLRARLTLIAVIAALLAPAAPAQDLGGFSSVLGGSSVFVFRPARKFFARPVTVVKVRPVGTRPGKAGVIDEPIPGEDWINESADNAINERKVSDSEPFLSLEKGYLNSRAYFCESPQFPAALRSKGRKDADLEVRATVAQYGGILQATSIKGDRELRAEAYRVLGSMNFRESYFLGEKIRIEGLIHFRQNPKNTILCRETTQELEVPAVIDGGTLNDHLTKAGLAIPASGFKGRVEVLIDENGNVSDAKLASGNAALSADAIAAVKKLKVRRSLIAGKPVKVHGYIEFS